MSRRLTFACCCLLAAAAPGQAKAKPADGRNAPARAGEDRTFRGTCSEATSRDLFSACDADGDDRLDVFEASASIGTVHDARDHGNFARIDKDRDGYVSWPEFDGFLRTTLHVGGTFRVRTCRPLAPAAPEAKPASPLQRFVQLHDANRNGALDAAEIDQYVARTRVPQGLAQQLRTLDVDRSGRVEEAELAPWFELSGQAPESDPAAGSLLLPPWAAGDADHNNTIDAGELAAMLRRLDPSLDRWAAELLRCLDRNRDGILQSEELPGPAAARAAAAVSGPGTGQLPKERPVR